MWASGQLARLIIVAALIAAVAAKPCTTFNASLQLYVFASEEARVEGVLRPSCTESSCEVQASITCADAAKCGTSRRLLQDAEEEFTNAETSTDTDVAYWSVEVAVTFANYTAGPSDALVAPAVAALELSFADVRFYSVDVLDGGAQVTYHFQAVVLRGGTVAVTEMLRQLRQPSAIADVLPLDVFGETWIRVLSWPFLSLADGSSPTFVDGTERDGMFFTVTAVDLITEPDSQAEVREFNAVLRSALSEGAMVKTSQRSLAEATAFDVLVTRIERREMQSLYDTLLMHSEEVFDPE
ncbi:hypothetical protein H632_c148p3, partial [Helicosporidium sp. ATCC 50920]